MPDQSPDVMSVEFFAANDPQDGSVSGITMAVPCRCGLIEADTLRVHGLVMLADERAFCTQYRFARPDTGEPGQFAGLGTVGCPTGSR